MAYLTLVEKKIKDDLNQSGKYVLKYFTSDWELNIEIKSMIIGKITCINLIFI